MIRAATSLKKRHIRAVKNRRREGCAPGPAEARDPTKRGRRDPETRGGQFVLGSYRRTSRTAAATRPGAPRERKGLAFRTVIPWYVGLFEGGKNASTAL
jgi:hypothetical protein